jgi:uncharacterized protein (DUF1499 family)
MSLRKVGPALSIVAVGIALCLLALGPLGSRLGWWHYGVGVYQMLPASGLAAAGALSLSLATLVLGGSKLRPAMVAVLALCFSVATSLIYVPLQYAYARHTLPSINDISTDTADRPAFHAVLAAREAELMDRIDVPEPQLSQLQRAGYPEIAPFRAALTVRQAFDEALAVAQLMPGWTIAAADPDTGRIEASQRSRWFDFTDDIVIRVIADVGGSRIDMRSASRKGRRDYGVNAARISAYMGALKKRIEVRGARPLPK